MNIKKAFPVTILFFVLLLIIPSKLYSQPTILSATTADSDGDGYIDQISIFFSETVDVTGPASGLDCFDITPVTYTIDNNDYTGTVVFPNPLVVGLNEIGVYDTGEKPTITYRTGRNNSITATGGGPEIIDGEFEVCSDGANPVLVAVEVTRLNISGTDWWNRINLTYSETVWCGDLAPGSGLAASDNGTEPFAGNHGGDYANGVIGGYGSFASGGDVLVPTGEVGVTVEAGGVVRFDLGRGGDGKGYIQSGSVAPSGDFEPVANTGIRDADGNSLVTITPVSTTPGTAWDLDKPTIVKAATYDWNSDGSIDRIEFEISDASSNGIQDGFNAANFDITGYTGESFSTGVTGISGGVSDNDANDNRFSITFTQAGPWDTAATPGYSYTGADIFLVDLAGNLLDNTSGTASDGALPAFKAIVTADADEDGYIDRLQLEFSENVDINDAGGAGDGLDCISITGYTVASGDYGATDVNSITLNLVEGGSYDTGAAPNTSYNTGGSSTIRDRAGTPNEMLNGETTTTSDGAGPIMLSAVFYDPDANDIEAGDYIQVEFTENMQLLCTDISDFVLLNAAFGDTFGAGAYLDDDVSGDVYINIVLGSDPYLILPDIWSSPGAGNPSGLGIKAGGTTCTVDLASNSSPQGAEVDIGGAGSNSIVSVTATDGSSVFTNPYTQSAFMDADITLQIKTQFNASFVAVWFDVGAVPDGLSVTNPDDRKSVATGSGTEWTATIPHDDSEFVEGSTIQFIIDIDGALYFYDGSEATGGSIPWQFSIIYEQPRRVTIRNNIINPQIGDLAYINYYLESRAGVKITVYDLAGNPVIVLFNGSGSVGTNLVTWNGKNQRGAIVVPGVYYILIRIGSERFVRKVLVVK